MTVLDASAMIAYLRNEAGAEIVTSYLLDDQSECVAHAVNVMEVYYDFLRTGDAEIANSAIESLLGDGLTIREDMDADIWKDAAALKVSYKLSVADTFCIALARRLKCDVLTSDHHEMNALVNLGICDIRFIR